MRVCVLAVITFRMVTGVAMEVTISAATTTAGAGLVGDVAGSLRC